MNKASKPKFVFGWISQRRNPSSWSWCKGQYIHSSSNVHECILIRVDAKLMQINGIQGEGWKHSRSRNILFVHLLSVTVIWWKVKLYAIPTRCMSHVLFSVWKIQKRSPRNTEAYLKIRKETWVHTGPDRRLLRCHCPEMTLPHCDMVVCL